MATLNYIIKSARKETFATLWVRLRDGRAYDLFVQSGYSLPPELWNNKTQRIKPRFIETEEFTQNRARELINNLNTLKSVVLNALNDSAGQAINKEWLQKIINNFHNPQIAAKARQTTLRSYISRFIKEMNNGERLNINKKQYTHSTVKNYKGFEVQFNEFCQARRKSFDFADITIDFYNDFVAFFTKKNYSINTIGRHVKELKIIMRAAREEGFHNNAEIESRKFRVLTTKVDNIYLNETELKSMLALDLSRNRPKEIARDVFLVGCYTAQRYSDYSIINETNIRTLENGQRVIDLKQQKTGNHVIIPMRPEVFAILKKYNYRLPKTYEQKVNKYIKEIAEQADIIEPIEVEEMQNGKTIKRIVKKYELVKTHTARRSGATNMYLAKIPTIAIMKITGHKTEKEFMKYIKITEEESAMDLMNHPFFSGGTMN